VFIKTYAASADNRLQFVSYQIHTDPADKNKRIIVADITDNGILKTIEGKGNGVLEGFVNALSACLDTRLSVMDYSEHALHQGSDATAICYMEIACPKGKKFGAAIDQYCLRLTGCCYCCRQPYHGTKSWSGHTRRLSMPKDE